MTVVFIVHFISSFDSLESFVKGSDMLLHYTGFSSVTKSVVGFIEGTQPKVHFHSCKVVLVCLCSCVFAVMFRLFECRGF